MPIENSNIANSKTEKTDKTDKTNKAKEQKPMTKKTLLLGLESGVLLTYNIISEKIKELENKDSEDKKDDDLNSNPNSSDEIKMLREMQEKSLEQLKNLQQDLEKEEERIRIEEQQKELMQKGLLQKDEKTPEANIYLAQSIIDGFEKKGMKCSVFQADGKIKIIVHIPQQILEKDSNFQSPISFLKEQVAEMMQDLNIKESAKKPRVEDSEVKHEGYWTEKVTESRKEKSSKEQGQSI